MRTPVYTNCFEKELKQMIKRGKDPEKAKIIVRKLIFEDVLEPRYRDHKLSGSLAGRRECHIEPDWLLIYKLEDREIVFERTGTHSDLFE